MSTQVLTITLKSIELGDIRAINLMGKTIWSEEAPSEKTDEIDILVTYSQKKDDGSVYSEGKMRLDLAEMDYEALKTFIIGKILPCLNNRLGFSKE